MVRVAHREHCRGAGGHAAAVVTAALPRARQAEGHFVRLSLSENLVTYRIAQFGEQSVISLRP